MNKEEAWEKSELKANCDKSDWKHFASLVVQDAYKQGFEDATPKWKHVSELSRGSTVLVVLDGRIDIGHFDEEFGWSYAYECKATSLPTHFMELPELPVTLKLLIQAEKHNA